MSYENTACPCGGKKLTNTMLCADCNAALASHPAMKFFNDPKESTLSRRNAAIILLSLSRERKTKRQPWLTVQPRPQQPVTVQGGAA